MNGTTAKLLRQVFDPSEGPERRREFRTFKRAYTKSSGPQQVKARFMARKIAAARSKGQEIKQFRIDEQTHQAVPIGASNERPADS